MSEPLPAELEEIVALATDPVSARALFVQALTHPTYSNERRVPHNQRLEFLGDAVLELIVSRVIFDALPEAAEGLLSRVRARVVNEASLADGARKLALGPSMRLGRGEKAKGEATQGFLADALESIVAAAFLSVDLSAASTLVHASIGDAIATAVLEAKGVVGATSVDARAKDSKSLLQEIAQASDGKLPVYDVEQSGPIHSATFRARVSVGGERVGRGEGRSKREAETRAAEDALASIVAQDRTTRGPKTPVEELTAGLSSGDEEDDDAAT
ncbi:MAG: ribonuclease III [Polyangiales bacterium]